MDNESLSKIRDRIAALPVLKERLEKLRMRIKEAERDVQSLLSQYEKESLDVERLKKDSLSSTILKLAGKYKGKLDKEEQEMLSAKMKYDRACQRVSELNQEREDLERRIRELNKERQIYEAELKKREEVLLKDINSEVAAKYRQMEAEKENIIRQLSETDEALRAAKRAKSTALSALNHLGSAEGWATYDVWFKGGIISHMAKYGHIDNAEADFNRLYSQLKDLQRELADVNLAETVELAGIDSTTRAIDFWFDNIFTDLSVRNRIRGDMEQLRSLTGRIDRIVDRLERNKSYFKEKIEELERRKNDLIVSM